MGVDGRVFFGLSVHELEGVCGHTRAYDHMCEFRHNNTDPYGFGDTDNTGEHFHDTSDTL
jgi:hypothetical protein